MLPLYFAAAGMSWALCGDFAAWNVFERQAGLADGGYAGLFARLWQERSEGPGRSGRTAAAD